MTPPVDPNDVLMTGENSFIRLSQDGGKTQSDRFSHWRVLWCPAGPGHALFAQSELTAGQARIYSDNPAVARRFEVMAIPTLILFLDGEPKKRLIGAKGKGQLLQELEEFL